MLLGLDSDVVAYVLAKGRTASRKLARPLRRLGAEVLFADLQIGILRVASSQNPADDPSRRRPVRRGPCPQGSKWGRKVLKRPSVLREVSKHALFDREKWLFAGAP
jgi:hypothetical protein